MEHEGYFSELKELCFIYNERNKLDATRNKCRHKRNYLSAIKRAWRIHKNFEGSSYAESLNKHHSDNPLYLAEAKERYLQSNPLPKKFAKLNMVDIRLLLLNAESLHVAAKLAVANHTKKTHKRVLKLLKLTGFKPIYRNGVVLSLVKQGEDPTKHIFRTQMAELATQFELDNEITKILEVE